MKIAAYQSVISGCLLLLASFSSSSRAQAPVPYSPAIEARAQAIVDKMTLDEKLAYVGGTGFAVRAIPRLNLPAIEMSDGPYGTRSNAGLPSTTYAAGIGLAASWNPSLAAQVGGGIGKDARARGVHFMLGPGVNIYRSPRNGRNFEYFGEDPFLTSAIADGYITGMQQQGVSATIKHFLANNSEFLRHDSDSVIDERTLREIYLPAFESAVKTAHVGAIMDSYNLINGAHATQNSYFNTQIVRKEWGFDSVMMSDWDATYDGVSAANGGLDIEMPTGKFMSPATLGAAIKAGTVTEATINEKILHILTTAIRFGWLDRTQTDPSISIDNVANGKIALQAARESIVLLKNSNSVLPLDRSALKTVLVLGPDAYPGVAVGGGSAGVKPFHMVSPLEGISNLAGDSVGVSYLRGLPTLVEAARATEFTTAAEGGRPGVTVETFDNGNLTGAPVKTTTQPHIVFRGTSWATIADEITGGIDAFFKAMSEVHESSRRTTGYFNASAAGRYLLALQGSGEGTGNRVYVDGKLLIDDWTIVRADQPLVSLDLTAGPHKIVVEDAQHGFIGGRLEVCVVAADKIVDRKAVELAAKADAVVISAGYDSDSEGEGGDRTFHLPLGQDELIKEVAAVNKRTIVTVTSGGNVDSTAWIDSVPAAIEAWYGGQEGGTALAEILFGEVNPSGHLPATFERHAEDNPAFANYYPEGDSKKVVYKEGIFVGYRGYEHNHTAPLFPFGYGLSYTTFSFANLNVAGDSASPRATVTFDVTNSGKIAGAEVAQVYIAPSNSTVPMPEKQLKGFQKVMLQPGETKSVSIDLDARSFAYYDVDAKTWKITPGNFGVLVGDSSASLPLKGALKISPATAAKADFR
jgi:beta-glucosidase